MGGAERGGAALGAGSKQARASEFCVRLLLAVLNASAFYRVPDSVLMRFISFLD